MRTKAELRAEHDRHVRDLVAQDENAEAVTVLSEGELFVVRVDRPGMMFDHRTVTYLSSTQHSQIGVYQMVWDKGPDAPPTAAYPCSGHAKDASAEDMMKVWQAVSEDALEVLS